MSVVNQMLRDLDRRNSQTGTGLPQYLKPVRPERAARPGLRIAAVLVASVAVGAGATWMLKPGHAGNSEGLGLSREAPAMATPTGPPASVSQVASLAPGSGIVRIDTKPAPVLSVSATMPPAVIEQALPHADSDPVDITVVNFAQAELLVPPVMPPTDEVVPTKPRGDRKVKSRRTASTRSATVTTARRAPKGPVPAPEEVVRNRGKTVAEAVVPAPVTAAVPPNAPPRPANSVTASAEPISRTAAATASAPLDGPVSARDTQDALSIDKKIHDPSRPAADAEFRQAVTLMNKGRIEDALVRLRAALSLFAGHLQARQTLVALLVERRALDEAQQGLEEGLRLNPEQTGFASLLARILLDRGNSTGALQVLERHASYASANPHYRSFHAALLQRAGRHAEATDEFRAALMINPSVGPWWMGLGISAQALGRRDAATSAFQNARNAGNLSPELVAFVEQRLRQLQ